MIGSRNISQIGIFQMIESFNKLRTGRKFIKAFIKGVDKL